MGVILGMVAFIPSQSGTLGGPWADSSVSGIMLAKCRAQDNAAGWAEGAGLDWVSVGWPEVAASGTGCEYGAGGI